MPTLSDLKQSKFLTKADVTPPKLLTIAGYQQINVAMEGEAADMKYVLTFHEHEKPLVLNPTNGQIIAAIADSEDFDDWVGKQIVLFNDHNISFQGRLVGGIRARAPKKPATTAAPAAAPKPAPAPETADDDVPF